MFLPVLAEARVPLGYRLEQLLRFFRSLQTNSRVHPELDIHTYMTFIIILLFYYFILFYFLGPIDTNWGHLKIN